MCCGNNGPNYPARKNVNPAVLIAVMTPIRIRVLRHSAFYTPLLVTIAAGLLANEGLQPHYDIARGEHAYDEVVRTPPDSGT